MRCVHEASLYDNNCFLTLTYNDENLPDDGSLRKRDFQLFMKRLRKKFRGARIRFFHCGEYGERYLRPHYHALLFNFDFSDRVLHSERDGNRIYISKTLDDLWGLGFASIGSVTFESAAYVARYVMKKVTGDLAASHYERVHSETGEVVQVEPEYCTMSRRPGIGRDWFSKYSEEVFPDDEVVVRGRLMKPPRFYDSIHEVEDPSAFQQMKAAREEEGYVRRANSTPERLRVREKVHNSRLSFLKRTVE